MVIGDLGRWNVWAAKRRRHSTVTATTAIDGATSERELLNPTFGELRTPTLTARPSPGRRVEHGSIHIDADESRVPHATKRSWTERRSRSREL